jgi:hypothetical protein
MRRVLFALVAAVLAGVPAASASAQASEAAEPGEPAQAAPGETSTDVPTPNITVKEDRLVCRPRVRTGTRMGTSRVCRTQQEWVEEARTQEQDGEAVADKLDVLSSRPLVRSEGSLGPR